MAGEVEGSALIGRAVELGRLDAVLERAERGRPQVVLVAGDAGVGKTRLLLALAERARRRGTLGVIEQYDDPAKACSLFAAARAQAAAAGNPEIELRALYDLAEVSNQLGDLATACTAADDGTGLAERTGLGWSRSRSSCAAGSSRPTTGAVTGTSASG